MIIVSHKKEAAILWDHYQFINFYNICFYKCSDYGVESGGSTDSTFICSASTVKPHLTALRTQPGKVVCDLHLHESAPWTMSSSNQGLSAILLESNSQWSMTVYSESSSVAATPSRPRTSARWAVGWVTRGGPTLEGVRWLPLNLMPWTRASTLLEATQCTRRKDGILSLQFKLIIVCSVNRGDHLSQVFPTN